MRQLYSFYTDAFLIAVKSILEHKLRAFLTRIGIIIGVASVVVVGASISGLNSYVTDKVSKVLGIDHFMMARMAFSGRMDDEEFERRNRLNKKLTMDEYEYIKANCVNCSEVGAQMNAGTDLKENGVEMPSVRILGVTANMIEIEEKEIESGRFVSNDEVMRSAKVCVIGYDIKDKFFPNSDPIGQTIRIRGVPVLIVGLEEKRGSMFGQSQDRMVYIPRTCEGGLMRNWARREQPTAVNMATASNIPNGLSKNFAGIYISSIRFMPHQLYKSLRTT